MGEAALAGLLIITPKDEPLAGRDIQARLSCPGLPSATFAPLTLTLLGGGGTHMHFDFPGEFCKHGQMASLLQVAGFYFSLDSCAN